MAHGAGGVWWRRGGRRIGGERGIGGGLLAGHTPHVTAPRLIVAILGAQLDDMIAGGQVFNEHRGRATRLLVYDDL